MSFALALFLAPLAAGDLPPPRPDTAFSGERIGAFRLIREHYRNTGVPIMHASPEWTKVRLVWRSSDGLTEVQLEDDGFTLQASYMAESAVQRHSCISNAGLSRYGKGPPTGAFWKADRKVYLKFVKTCAAVDRSKLPIYEAEHRLALADFPAALERMQAMAVDAFRQIDRRCIRYESRYYDVMVGPQCARYSGEKK